MKKKAGTSSNASELRRRAGLRLGEGRTGVRRSRRADPNPAADSARLVHELQVHQVELEMQNAELAEAQNRLEALVEKYTDLYDYAPIGYFSLDERGRILEVNLKGAALLGRERSRLLGGNLARLVAPSSQAVFLGFLARVFAGTGDQVCEAALVTRDGGSFWVGFHGIAVLSEGGPSRRCRLAVSDITALMEAKEARLRMESLSVANLGLEREIIRRRAVEEALKSSQRDQARLLSESRAMQEQLRRLSHQFLRAQEEERKRISRELHDEITQTLVNINVQLETLARDAQVNPASLRERITRTQRVVEEAVRSVHEFARELRPTLLDDLGLIPTLHSCLKDFAKRTGVQVRLTTSTGLERLNSAGRTVLYRVAQSALTNVAQHAQARRVKVRLRRVPGAVRMEIQDDGRSFDVERVLHARPGRRLGLLGMRERVEMVGGSFAVISAPGEGTTVRVQIPYRL